MRQDTGTINLACTALSILLLLPCLAWATNTPIGDIFCVSSGWATGNTGKALAAIAIIVMGMYKLIGRISGRVFLLTLAGIALVFGASSVVDALNIGNAGTGSATAYSSFFGGGPEVAPGGVPIP